MSELIQKTDNRTTIRWKLLTGVSALALAAYAAPSDVVRAEEAGQPQIWIELGGQLSALENGQEIFAPDFPNSPSRPPIFSASQKFEHPPRFSYDEVGKISFQPDSSSWVFSASIVYGRSASNHHFHQQTYPGTARFSQYPKYMQPTGARFADTEVHNHERHFLLDFQAGKDVGLGLFGRGATSILAVGVRFAQFSGSSNISLKSDPDWHFNYKYLTGAGNGPISQAHHSNLAEFNAQRNFHGLGPSISWNASVPVAGNVNDGQIAMNWGVQAAALFGRQKARTEHHKTARYQPPKYSEYIVSQTAPPAQSRSRSITVPNVGGSIGLSYRIEDFKVALGYRADFFFNAIDGGIDARKNENRGFNGPYASISIGIGD